MPETLKRASVSVRTHAPDPSIGDTGFENIGLLQTDITTALADEIAARQNKDTDLEENKIPYPLYPHSKYGNPGDILRTDGEGHTVWVPVGQPTDEQTQDAIYNWLDEHPEATTTVENGSLTEAKFSDELKLKAIKDYVTPQMFGAKGDGEANDTSAIQAAINSGKIIYLLGTYKIRAGIQLTSNIRIYGFGEGTIIKDSEITTYYSALYYYNTTEEEKIKNVIINGIRIVGVQHWTGKGLSGLANDFGMRIKNSENIKIINCTVEECGGCAIFLEGINNEITGNTIIYTGDFPGWTITNPSNYNFGINYRGESFRIIGNKISGVIQGIIASTTNKNVIISNNDISTSEHGQHGLYMESAENVNVGGNVIHDCAICGVKFQLNTPGLRLFKNFNINNNTIINCGAQGILVVDMQRAFIVENEDPGNRDIKNITISSNVINNCQRQIELLAVENALITNNIIRGDSSIAKYGIFLQGSNKILVSGNRIEMGNGTCIFFDTYPNYNSNKTEVENPPLLYARSLSNITVSNNYIILNNVSSTAYYAIHMRCSTLSKFIKSSLFGNKIHFEGTNDISDGIFFQNRNNSTFEDFYILNNIGSGFRWDLRVLYSTGITEANNYFAKKTGI